MLYKRKPLGITGACFYRTDAIAAFQEQEGLAEASIARDVGSSSTNRSSDIMHFLPTLLKKTLQHEL